MALSVVYMLVFLLACEPSPAQVAVGTMTDEGAALCKQLAADCAQKGSFALVGVGKPYQIAVGNMQPEKGIPGATNCVLTETKQMDWGLATWHVCKLEMAKQ